MQGAVQQGREVTWCLRKKGGRGLVPKARLLLSSQHAGGCSGLGKTLAAAICSFLHGLCCQAGLSPSKALGSGSRSSRVQTGLCSAHWLPTLLRAGICSPSLVAGQAPVWGSVPASQECLMNITV